MPEWVGTFDARVDSRAPTKSPRRKDAGLEGNFLPDDAVERGARAHRLGGEFVAGLEVAAGVDGVALHGDQLLDDLGFARSKRFSDRRELGLEVGVGVLSCEGLGPIFPAS